MALGRFVALTAALGNLYGQQTAVLTLEDCIRLAGGVPSVVSLARQDREIASQERTIARAGLLPRGQINSGFTYNSPSLSNRNEFSFVALNGVREYVALGSLIQELDTSGRLRADLARARALQDVAGASLGLAQRDLRRAVTNAYYRVLLARKLAVVIDDALRESESFERRARLLFEGGEAARADVVKAAAQAAFLRQQLKSAQLQAATANQDLASFWMNSAADVLNLEDVLEKTPPEPVGEPTAAPFLRRLEFNLLDAQKRVLDAEAKRAKAGLYPQTMFQFQYGFDVNALQARNRGYAATLSLTVPVFDWFRTASTARQLRLRAEQVSTGRSISERELSAEYINAQRRVRDLFEQITLTADQMKLAEEDLSLSRVRYEGGEGSALDVVTAQNQLAQARSNHYANIASYLMARLDLEVASGR